MATQTNNTNGDAIPDQNPSGTDQANKASDQISKEQESVKFLVFCIKHSDNGKINWEAVAEDAGVVTKGAAAKKYERLLKSYGVSPAKKPSAKAIATPDVSPAKSTDVKATPTKKRGAPKTPKTQTPTKKPRTKLPKSPPAVVHGDDDGADEDPKSSVKAESKSDEDAKSSVKADAQLPKGDATTDGKVNVDDEENEEGEIEDI